MRNSIFKSYTKKILRSEAFVSVIIVFVLALGIIGTSYALYMDVDTDTNYQLVEVGDLSIGFDNGDNTITLNNMLPQEDENAIKSSDNLFSFYIYNRGTYTIDYDIKLITEEDNTIEANYINYQICRDNSENCSDIKTLGTKNEDETVNINNPILSDSLLAKKSTDASNPSAYYFLRIWINNTYKGTETGTIKYKVEVTATNASGDINSSNTLAGTILNNAKIAEEENSTDRTIYSPEPLTKPAEEVNGENERTLSQTQDDYGTSYYFRGNVDDNYVNFAGMCWRIVRIAGDGSIKLILEDQDQECDIKDDTGNLIMDGNWNIPTETGGTTITGNFGYDDVTYSGKNVLNYLNPSDKYKETAMSTAFNSFQSTLTNYELSNLNNGDWCINDNAYLNETLPLTIPEKENYYINNRLFYYDTNIRLGVSLNTVPTLTLKCNGTILDKFKDNTEKYVGTLTVDEIALAGGKIYGINYDYYLVNEYQKEAELSFWTISPNEFDGHVEFAFRVINSGGIGYSKDHVLVDEFDTSFRPAINLKAGTLYKSGNGKQETPYEIKMSNTENKVDETTE